MMPIHDWPHSIDDPHFLMILFMNDPIHNWPHLSNSFNQCGGAEDSVREYLAFGDFSRDIYKICFTFKCYKSLFETKRLRV